MTESTEKIIDALWTVAGALIGAMLACTVSIMMAVKGAI